jgi:peptide/nickel transport system substrate-binding protein
MKTKSFLVFMLALGFFVAGFGVLVQAADCPKIADQKDLNPLILKNADMPDPEAVKSATCGGITAATLIARPRTLNPVTTNDTPSTDIIFHMFDTLTGGTVDEPTGFMAEAFEVKKVGSTGESVTYTLRKGVKFSDGTPITAEDVRFTVENLIFPKDIVNSARDGYACGDGKLPTVKVDAANKITFTCAVTRRGLVTFMDPGFVLNKKRVLELVPNVEKSPKDFNSALGLNTPIDKFRGLGTGPFILTKIDPSNIAEFVRNPFYWNADEKGNQLPYLNGNRILIAPVQGNEIALAQFRNGQTDWINPRPEDIAVLQSDKAQKGFQVNDDIDGATPAGGTAFWVMSWTTKSPALRAVFKAKEFRQAMSHITDRATIKKNIQLGLATETAWHLNPASSFYIERQGQTKEILDRAEKAKFNYSLDKANALLDKLGLVKGADGIRTIPANFQGQGNPAGKVEFTLNTNVGNTVREEIIKLIATEGRKVGVNVKAEPKDFAALVDQLLIGDYEAIMIGLTGGIIPDTGLNVYTCEGNLHMWNVDCPKNPTEFEKKLDELYFKGAAATKREDAQKIWDEAQLLVGEFQPLVHITIGNALYAHRTDTLKNHGRDTRWFNVGVYFCTNGKCRGG